MIPNRNWNKNLLNCEQKKKLKCVISWAYQKSVRSGELPRDKYIISYKI